MPIQVFQNVAVVVWLLLILWQSRNMNLVKKLLIIILVQLICVFLFIRHNQLPLTHDEDSQTFSGHFDKAKAKKAVLQEVMCAEDKIKVARMASLFEKDNPSAQDFFGVVYFPLQSICESVKIIGKSVAEVTWSSLILCQCSWCLECSSSGFGWDWCL